MRTIKYRGYSKELQKWIYGDLCHAWDKSFAIMPRCYFGTRDFGDTDENENPIISEEIADGGFIKVENESVGQFIDKQDKNGVDIYEKDIVDYSVLQRFCKNENCDEKLEQGINRFCSSCGTPIEDSDFITRAKVVYDRCAFGYRQEHKEDNTYQHWLVCTAEMHIAWVEVKGNTFSNPEII